VENELFRTRVVREKAILHDLGRLIPLLRAMEFTETAIGRALETRPFTFRRQVHLPVYRARLRDCGVLGTAILFFLLQQPIELQELRGCIGDHALSALHQMGWLSLGGSGVRCRVSLYPCGGRYFWTDHSAPLEPWSEQVYWLGEDSYTLAYCTSRIPRKRSLDLCTGSGVHAILAAGHCVESMGIDINPRALEFGRLNATFNSSNTQFHNSDCYAEVTGDFDLITLNPPFAPAPIGTSELYRAGGPTGEAVSEQVVRGLPQFLRPGGIFSMGTEAPRIQNASPLQRMADWLGAGWGVAALYKHEFSIENYIQSHVLASVDYASQKAEADYERWLAVYLELGITSMVAAQFFAVRGPSFQAERPLSTPLVDHSDLTADWLAALASSGPAVTLHENVKQVYDGQDRVVIEFHDGRWHKGLVQLEQPAAAVVRQLREGDKATAEEEVLQNLAGEMIIRRAFV